MEVMDLDRLVDSVILIDHLNGAIAATGFLEKLDPRRTAISVITRAEILSGLAERDWVSVMPLLDQFRLLNIDGAVADLDARLRREFRWKLPDAFQAALATFHRVKFSTRNTKDFDPKKHSFVEIPYTLR